MKNEWGSIYWDDTLSNEFLLKHERSCCILGLCLNQRTVQRTLANKQTKRSLSFRDMRFVDTFTSVFIWKEVKSEALPSGSQDFRCHIRIHLFHLRLVTWLSFNAFLFWFSVIVQWVALFMSHLKPYVCVWMDLNHI